jgi:adenylosuccinate synthase
MTRTKQIDVMLGMQMGDEGKGRFTHQFAGEGYEVVARYNGGANAGHTFDFLNQEINTHQIPSGISYPGVKNLLTNCSLFDPAAIVAEMAELESKGIAISPDNLGVSESASLVLPHHIMLDAARETSSKKQGSTVRGISQVAADKFGRSGVFFHQLETDPDAVEENVIQGIKAANVLLEEMGGNAWFKRRDPKEAYEIWLEAAEYMLPYMVDTTQIIYDTLDAGGRILAEGAQSIGLDIDHGIRPENTSSLTGVAGAQQSLCVGPELIDTAYGVGKLVKSRVGGSDASFPTKIKIKKLAAILRGTPGTPDYEAGKSTKRLRDVGYFDLTDIRTAIKLNGISKLLLTKLDCVPLFGPTVKVATHYEDRKGNIRLGRPNHVDFMKGFKPKYGLELPTWTEDIRGVTRFSDLPKNARIFVNSIEAILDTEVIMLGTGPGATDKIDLRNQ